jgi:hypothetical protein
MDEHYTVGYQSDTSDVYGRCRTSSISGRRSVVRHLAL